MRSSWLLFICLLSGITATDSQKSCVMCVAENAKTCQGKVEKCPLATDKCISILEVTKIAACTGEFCPLQHVSNHAGSFPCVQRAEFFQAPLCDGQCYHAVPQLDYCKGTRETSLFMRLCGNCSLDKPMTVRFGKGILKINKTCCNTDECTPLEPTIPPEKPGTKDEKHKSNGIRCKSCFAENSKACDCNTFVNCSGEEMKCIARQISASNKTSPEGHNHVEAIRGCATKDMCQYLAENITLKTMTLKTSFTCSDESDSIHNSLLLLVLAATMFSKFTSAT